MVCLAGDNRFQTGCRMKSHTKNQKSITTRSCFLLLFSTTAFFLSFEQIFPVGNPSTYFLFTFKDGRVNFHIFVVAKHVPRGVLAPVFAKERPNLRGNVIIKVAFLGRRRGFRQAWRTRSLGSALAVRGRDSVSTRSVGSRSRCRRGGGGLFDLGWSILRRRRSLDV